MNYPAAELRSIIAMRSPQIISAVCDISVYRFFIGLWHTFWWWFHCHIDQRCWDRIRTSRIYPPQSNFLTSGRCLNISFAVMLLSICTTLLGDRTGTLWTRKCTWSSSVPISTKCISYHFPISMQMFLSDSSTLSVNTFCRYFAGQTIWYNIRVLLCRFRICSLIESFVSQKRQPRSRAARNSFD